MDTSIDRYLRRADGVPAEIWVAPSRGQLFWLRHAPALFAPPVEGGSAPVRWWGIATVTPSTNVTVLNLRYQSYLNLIFHRTALARIGHAVCMPLIVASMLAACHAVPFGAPAAAAGLAVWWVWWAVRERDALWGASGVALVAVLYALAEVAHRALAGPAPLAQPLAWVVLGSLLQAGSHVLEPLPPRVTRSPRWVPVGEYVFGAPGRRHRPGTVLRRLGHLAAQTVFGTLDELVASPRLLPVLLLGLLWRLGHDRDRRAAWRAQAARAIASGNPGLDFIGIGGSTPLRIPA
ncbi:hypothetical protein [Dactylosporangium sp. CA-092794]|uniref:hypothetical protein n=1 Tax=Dactylosporangium sp. CA-092794 TaxID=3239929 RepID=UPI003D8F49F9